LNLEAQTNVARNGDFYFHEHSKKYLSLRSDDGINWTKKKGENRLQETFQMIKVNNLEMIKGKVSY